MTGATSRYLGVRPGTDIRILYNGSVSPGQAGMSVSPWPPQNLPIHRRPPELGGTGKDPVFEMDTDGLPEELEYQPDSTKPDLHGFIRPAYTMLFTHYQQAIHSTRALWRLV
jgi:hypothetical protein